MRSQPEDRARGEPVDPFDEPARPPSYASDAPSPPAIAERQPERSDDAFWLSSYGYLLTQACDAARPQRPDLSDNEFAILANQAFSTLSGHTGSMAAEILAYIDAVRPRPAPEPPAERTVVSRRRLRLEQALAGLAAAGRVAPTQGEIAEACEPEITERTLRHWLQREPDLRDLLPWLPRRGRSFRKLAGF